MARRRGLTPEERELWSRVARTTTPRSFPAGRDDAGSPSERTISVVPASLRGPLPDTPPASAAPQHFRIGQSAGRAGSSFLHAPSPAESLAAAPLRMDSKLHRRLSQGKMRPEARLDLHGMTLAAAHPALVGFILSRHGQGARLVLVITGKGRGDHGPLPTRPGALRHQVPHWLHSPPLAAVVQQVTPAHYRHGGEGAYYVYLRKPRA